MEYFVVAVVVFILVCGGWWAWLAEVCKENDPVAYAFVTFFSIAAGGSWPLVLVLLCAAGPIYLVMLVVKQLLKRFYK